MNPQAILLIKLYLKTVPQYLKYGFEKCLNCGYVMCPDTFHCGRCGHYSNEITIDHGIKHKPDEIDARSSKHSGKSIGDGLRMRRGKFVGSNPVFTGQRYVSESSEDILSESSIKPGSDFPKHWKSSRTKEFFTGKDSGNESNGS